MIVFDVFLFCKLKMHLEAWQSNVVAGCKTRKDIEIQACILDSMMNRLDVYDEDCVSGVWRMYSLKSVHVTLFAIRFRGHGGLQ